MSRPPHGPDGDASTAPGDGWGAAAAGSRVIWLAKRGLMLIGIALIAFVFLFEGDAGIPREIWLAVGAGLVLVPVAYSIVDQMTQQRAWRVRKQNLEELKVSVGREVEAAVQSGTGLEETFQNLEHAGRSRGLTDTDLREARRTAVHKAATDDAGPYRQALEAGIDFLPGVPRSGVRYVNRVRLLSNLAVRRDLYAGEGAIEPSSVGFWAMLVENWPELAQALMVEPHWASELADSSQREDDDQGRSVFDHLVARLAPSCNGDPRLRKFFRCAGTWHDDLGAIVTLTPRREGGEDGAPGETRVPPAQSNGG